jgi:hypothetical protein
MQRKATKTEPLQIVRIESDVYANAEKLAERFHTSIQYEINKAARQSFSRRTITLEQVKP